MELYRFVKVVAVVAAMVVFTVPTTAFSSTGTTKKKRNPSVRAVKVPNRGAGVSDCWVRVSGTSFAQPCDRVGRVMTTASAMDIVGELPVVRVKR